MFAHQVIKDLRHYSSEFKKGCLRCQASKHSRALQYDSMIPGIIESQKFHMGDIWRPINQSLSYVNLDFVFIIV